MRRALGTLAALTLAACCCVPDDDVLPGDQPGDPAMICPFTDAAAFGPVNEAFSATGGAPWGFAHNGIDLFPLADGTDLRIVAAGTVVERTLWRNPTSQNWQLNVGIRFNAHYTVEYIFEPFSAVTADGLAQANLVQGMVGDIVSAGQTLGSVKVAGPGAHLHFGLKKDEAWVCPEPYFTEDAAAAVLGLIQRDHPTWAMCY